LTQAIPGVAYVVAHLRKVNDLCFQHISENIYFSCEIFLLFK